MKTLIVGEILDGALRAATLELVAFARKLGGDVVSLLVGSGIAGLFYALRVAQHGPAGRQSRDAGRIRARAAGGDAAMDGGGHVGPPLSRGR